MDINVDLPKIHYEPCERVYGTCTWDTHSKHVPKIIHIKLRLWNSGIGVPLITIVDTIKHKPVSSSGEIKFDFLLPPHPISYNRKYFKLHWGVQAELDEKILHLEEFIVG